MLLLYRKNFRYQKLIAELNYILNTFHRQQIVILGTTRRAKSTYSSTISLPKTSFPQRLEGNKRINLDQEIINSEEYKNFYAWQKKTLSSHPKYVLHDGPPYANGDPHIGHAVNKILKDITIRSKLLGGFVINYRPGWDCHGLPIGNISQKSKPDIAATNIILLNKMAPFIVIFSISELKAITSSENIALAKESPVKLRKLAREFADHTIAKVNLMLIALCFYLE